MGNVVRRMIQVVRETVPTDTSTSTSQTLVSSDATAASAPVSARTDSNGRMPPPPARMKRANSMYDAIAYSKDEDDEEDEPEKPAEPLTVDTCRLSCARFFLVQHKADRCPQAEFLWVCWGVGRGPAHYKPLIMNEISDVIDELESVHSSVASYAIEHIHSRWAVALCWDDCDCPACANAQLSNRGVSLAGFSPQRDHSDDWQVAHGGALPSRREQAIVPGDRG